MYSARRRVLRSAIRRDCGKRNEGAVALWEEVQVRNGRWAARGPFSAEQRELRGNGDALTGAGRDRELPTVE